MIIFVSIMMSLAIICCVGGIYCAVRDQRQLDSLRAQNAKLKCKLVEYEFDWYLKMKEEK